MDGRNIEGRLLNQIWRVEAKHALYRSSGDWYHLLTEFPGALFDKNGYILFATKEEFYSSPHLKIGKEVHIPGTIERIPGYIQVTASGKLVEVSDKLKEKLPRRKLIYENLIIRDTTITSSVKELCDYRCQICGFSLEISDSERYAEGHHIKPLGGNHKGPDIMENVLCVCPNHHILLDKGAIDIKLSEILFLDDHLIDKDFVDYHNKNIYNRIL